MRWYMRMGTRSTKLGRAAGRIDGTGEALGTRLGSQDVAVTGANGTGVAAVVGEGGSADGGGEYMGPSVEGGGLALAGPETPADGGAAGIDAAGMHDATTAVRRSGAVMRTRARNGRCRRERLMGSAIMAYVLSLRPWCDTQRRPNSIVVAGD
jgi:hypothetical protein